MADVMMFSPVPHKPFIQPTYLSPQTPSHTDELTSSRPLWYDKWYDDEIVVNELRDVLSCKRGGAHVLPDWLPAFQSRAPSSMASTSAGPTPGLDDASPLRSISPPLSPECTNAAGIGSGAGSECMPHTPLPGRCSPVSEKSSWMQERKVFVGGVPQYMGQSDLYKMFSKFAKVKKAWLQLMHSDNRARQVPAAQKHRGFGFVIFCDKSAVERMLGDALSKMICIDENVQVEVKRAVGKNGTFPVTPERQTLRNSDHGSAGSCSEAASPEPQTPQTPWQAQLESCDNLPYIPPFPADASPATEWQGNNNEALSFPMLPDMQSGPTTAAHTQATDPFLTGVLLNGLVGPQPRDTMELKLMLQQAMPDHYDD